MPAEPALVVPPALRRLGRLVLDAVLPPTCLGCNALVAEPGALCGECWPRLAFIGPPHCACCGRPFEIAESAGLLCGACLRRPPPYARARAVLAYDDGSKPLILGFKNADRLQAAPAFARWLARAGAELLAEADLLAPVPLHRWRLWRRRYNQAAILALAVGRLAGRPVLPELMVRRRRTPSQGHLGRAARRRNVAGAFAVPERHRGAVWGRSVLLIDDVLTTGATVEECSRVLLKAGARRVDVLTLARVLRPDGD
ncbi:MAG TPA: ComF family protein [Alphaproteobacteria bacterium]|nr:ComF family protein [Alphaproteobacteria bacterium]